MATGQTDRPDRPDRPRVTVRLLSQVLTAAAILAAVAGAMAGVIFQLAQPQATDLPVRAPTPAFPPVIVTATPQPIPALTLSPTPVPSPSPTPVGQQTTTLEQRLSAQAAAIASVQGQMQSIGEKLDRIEAEIDSSKSAESELVALSTRVTGIEEVVLKDPVEALSVPLLRRDLDDLESQARADQAQLSRVLN